MVQFMHTINCHGGGGGGVCVCDVWRGGGGGRGSGSQHTAMLPVQVKELL